MSGFLEFAQKPVPDPAWELDSFAVVACDGEGHGCVLWTAGPYMQSEMDQVGTKVLSDLGLDDAPLGISVWEGKYVWHPGSYEYPMDGDSEASGKFREPTDAEWAAIREGRCPWNDADWYTAEAETGK